MSTQNYRSLLYRADRRGRGVTLVETLIALLVLSIGLLGLAGLETTSLRFNTSAYYRTQATALAYDLADRMRANRQAALANAYNVAFQNPVPACGAVAAGATVSEQDIAAWRNALACRIPQSTGSVTRNGNEFVFTIRWDDSQGREPPVEFQFTTVL
jgi:type IV pilus assembly protein PilV